MEGRVNDESVRGVMRWAAGRSTGILAAPQVPDGDPGRLPVISTPTRALARIDADALDAAVGTFVFVQAHAVDPLDRVLDRQDALPCAGDGRAVPLRS